MKTRKFGEFTILSGANPPKNRSSYYDGLFESMKVGECLSFDSQFKAQNAALAGRKRGFKIKTHSDKSNSRYLVFLMRKSSDPHRG